MTDDAEKKKAWAALTPDEGDRTAEFDTGDKRKLYSIDCLIAIMPTPISPPLRYFFDSQREALESAAAAAGYVFDSYDLPWTSGTKDSSATFQLGGEIDISPSGKPTAESGWPYSLTTNTDSDTRWKRDSGVILFRHESVNDKDNPRLLLVFVVGEAPTYGINQAAMRDALDQITWLEGWQASALHQPAPHLVERFKHGTYTNQIRIVGPTFSGSAASLRNALEEWRRYSAKQLSAQGRDLSIQVISGTATAVKGTLSLDADEKAPIKVDFRSVQIPDSALSPEISHLLRDLADVPSPSSSASSTASVSHCAAAPPKPRRIVILHENTTYGNSVSNSDGTARTESENDGERAILEMTFPLHISQLRAAHQDSQSNPVKDPGIGHRDVDLPDESGQSRRDDIPAYSPRAATYDELVLDNLLNTVRRERFRYVGIVATDVEDLVFLVQQVRANCPDTVVFTTSADIRFLHTQVNTDLRGTLLFTTYPLFGDMQRWTASMQPETGLQTFPSDSAHGFYNAVLAQLDKPELMLDYRQPFDAESSYPVVQIGVVGREDIWPVAFWAPNLAPDSDVYLNNGKHTPRKPRIGSSAVLYPPAFQVLFFILNIGFLVCATTFLFGSKFSGLQGSWWLQFLLQNPAPGFRTVRYIFMMSFSAGMLVAEVIGLGFLLLPIRIAPDLTGNWLPLSGSFIPVAVFECLTGVMVVLVWVSSLRQMFGSAAGTWRPVAYAAAGLVPIGLAVWFIAHLWTRPHEFALFTFIRATHLHNGVSPLMPLTFLGIAGFGLAISHFWRAAMLEDRPLRGALLWRPPDPSTKGTNETASFRGVLELQTQVVRLLERRSERWPAARFLAILITITFLYFGLTKIGSAYSIDGPVFDVMFTAMGFGIYLLFSLAMLRFTLTWLGLRQLLQRLYFHPSRYSYKNLQLAVDPSHLENQKVRLFERRPGLTAVEYGLGCVRAILLIAEAATALPKQSDLVTDIKARRPLLQNDLAATEVEMENVLNSSGWVNTVAARVALYQKMAELSKEVILLFEPLWRLRATNPMQVDLHPLDLKTYAVDDKPTPDRMLLQQGELFVASRMVDFIRHVFPHLINLVGFSMPAVLAMVLAVSVYPFPAHDTLLWMSWTVLLATVGLSLYVFVGINRNPIISMLEGTEPGQFNWDSAFTVHLLLFAVIPVLTLLGAQYPGALSGGLSWIGSIFGGAGGSGG